MRAVMEIRVPFSTCNQPWTDRLQINGWSSELNRRYTRALLAELEANADEFGDMELTSVRLDGGHASHLGGEAVEALLRCVRSHYQTAPDMQVSMRCAASEISGASMPRFRRAGIGRFDLEMLSLSSTAFHRVNASDALDLYPLLCNSFLHSCQNDSLGLVLLVGAPLVSDIEVRRSFLEAPHYHCAHVIVESWTGADEERCAAQLADGRGVLAAAGFCEYAPGRFARPGCEDGAILALQDDSDDAVIGIGLGAQTRINGAVSVTTSELETYMAYSHDFTKITARVWSHSKN